MSTLTTCINKAGKALSPKDAEALTSLRTDYLADGLGEQAAYKAIDDLTETITAERDALVTRLKDLGGRVPEDRVLLDKSPQEVTAGIDPVFDGAIDENGQLELIHYAWRELTENDPTLWRTGASERVRSEMNSDAPKRTYFGIESATDNPYSRESMLGQVRHVAKVDPAKIYNANKNPEKLWSNRDTDKSQHDIKNAGYAGYVISHDRLGKVVALFDSVPLVKADSVLLSKSQVKKNITSYRKDVPGFSALVRHLQEDEQASLLSRQGAENLVKLVRELPSHDEIAAVAQSGVAKRGWYKNSARALVEVFGDDDAPPRS